MTNPRIVISLRHVDERDQGTQARTLTTAAERCHSRGEGFHSKAKIRAIYSQARRLQTSSRPASAASADQSDGRNSDKLVEDRPAGKFLGLQTEPAQQLMPPGSLTVPQKASRSPSKERLQAAFRTVTNATNMVKFQGQADGMLHKYLDERRRWLDLIEDVIERESLNKEKLNEVLSDMAVMLKAVMDEEFERLAQLLIEGKNAADALLEAKTYANECEQNYQHYQEELEPAVGTPIGKPRKSLWPASIADSLQLADGLRGKLIELGATEDASQAIQELDLWVRTEERWRRKKRKRDLRRKRKTGVSPLEQAETLWMKIARGEDSGESDGGSSSDSMEHRQISGGASTSADSPENHTQAGSIGSGKWWTVRAQLPRLTKLPVSFNSSAGSDAVEKTRSPLRRYNTGQCRQLDRSMTFDEVQMMLEQMPLEGKVTRTQSINSSSASTKLTIDCARERTSTSAQPRGSKHHLGHTIRELEEDVSTPVGFFSTEEWHDFLYVGYINPTSAILDVGDASVETSLQHSSPSREQDGPQSPAPRLTLTGYSSRMDSSVERSSVFADVQKNVHQAVTVRAPRGLEAVIVEREMKAFVTRPATVQDWRTNRPDSVSSWGIVSEDVAAHEDDEMLLPPRFVGSGAEMCEAIIAAAVPLPPSNPRSLAQPARAFGARVRCESRAMEAQEITSDSRLCDSRLRERLEQQACESPCAKMRSTYTPAFASSFPLAAIVASEERAALPGSSSPKPGGTPTLTKWTVDREPFGTERCHGSLSDPMWRKKLVTVVDGPMSLTRRQPCTRRGQRPAMRIK